MNVFTITLVAVALICEQAEPGITTQYNYTKWQKQLERFEAIARGQNEVIKNQTEMINDLGKRMDQLMNQITQLSNDSNRYLKESNDYLKMENNELCILMNKSMADMEAKENAKNKAANCADILYNCQTQSGIYTIDIGCGSSNMELQVQCDMDLGGGWTVIQRRFNGSLSFAQNWTNYKSGFGTPDGEYWIGNDNIHLLTSFKMYQLLIKLTAHDGMEATAIYDSFWVADESDNYRMALGTFIGGVAGDSLSYHNGMQFSTYDNNNDKSSGSCSEIRGRGGWWYKNCANVNLNGVYYKSDVSDMKSLYWYHWRNNYNALKSSVMAIRPKNF